MNPAIRIFGLTVIIVLAIVQRANAAELEIESLEYPLTQISLSDGFGNRSNLFSCSEGELFCQIDLLAPDEWNTAYSVYSPLIPLGNYRTLDYVTCPQFSLQAVVKGSLELNGVTWYTTPGTTLLTSDFSSYGSTELEAGECWFGYVLPKEISVEQDLEVTFLLSARNLFFVSATDGSAPRLEVSSLAMLPVVDGGGAIETYVVTSSDDEDGSKAFGLLELFFDTSGAFVGGITRKYSGHDFSGGIARFLRYGVSRFERTADGSYIIEVSAYNNQSEALYGKTPSAGPIYTFKGFKRETHWGELEMHFGPPTYKAIRIDR